ncbi:hypothetical protein BKA93DRAFT_781595 [Sparassis latifolia]
MCWSMLSIAFTTANVFVVSCYANEQHHSVAVEAWSDVARIQLTMIERCRVQAAMCMKRRSEYAMLVNQSDTRQPGRWTTEFSKHI